MKKKKKLKRWLRDQLNNKFRAGFGKPKEKGIHNETPYIHSEKTFKTYLSQCNHFADWCLTQNVKDVDEAFTMVQSYGKHLEEENKSAWSIYTAISAIAKAYGVSTKDFGYMPPKRERAAIKRSRYATERDKHFSVANNALLITFVSCSGLRRHELAKLHGTALCRLADGTYYLKDIKGKGGKVRNVPLIGNEKELKDVVELMEASKDGLVFNHIHTAFDEHYYRSIYACRAYKSVARNTDTLPRNELYICKKDKKGIKYDKRAMGFASRALGHNRIDVVAENYLYNL